MPKVDKKPKLKKAPKKIKRGSINQKKHINKLGQMLIPFEKEKQKSINIDYDNFKISNDSDYSSSSSSSSDSDSDSDSDEFEFNPIVQLGNRKKVESSQNRQLEFDGVNIGYIPTNKDEIEQRFLAKEGYTPRPYSAFHIICGKTSSGKSNMLISTLLNPLIFGFDGSGKHWFDNVFCLSNSSDDIYDVLIEEGVLKPNHIKHLPDEIHLKMIIDQQKKAVKLAGDDVSKIPCTLIILDDIIDNKQFMNSKYVKLLAIRSRQLHVVTILLSQYFHSIPKLMRMQVSSYMLFAGSQQEQEAYNDLLCPAGMHKKQFDKVMEFAWEKRENDKFPFLHVNTRNPIEKRYMRNFNEVIHVPGHGDN